MYSTPMCIEAVMLIQPPSTSESGLTIVSEIKKGCPFILISDFI
jgi:hypothetical protein